MSPPDDRCDEVVCLTLCELCGPDDVLCDLQAGHGPESDGRVVHRGRDSHNWADRERAEPPEAP